MYVEHQIHALMLPSDSKHMDSDDPEIDKRIEELKGSYQSPSNLEHKC